MASETGGARLVSVGVGVGSVGAIVGTTVVTWGTGDGAAAGGDSTFGTSTPETGCGAVAGAGAESGTVSITVADGGAGDMVCATAEITVNATHRGAMAITAVLEILSPIPNPSHSRTDSLRFLHFDDRTWR